MKKQSRLRGSQLVMAISLPGSSSPQLNLHNPRPGTSETSSSKRRTVPEEDEANCCSHFYILCEESDKDYHLPNEELNVGEVIKIPEPGSCGKKANLFEKDKFKSNAQAAKAVVAEILGTAFLVLFGCGSWIYWGLIASCRQRLQIAVAFGFIIASMVQTIGHISGCNINPAVTIGLLVYGRIGLERAVLYVLAQCIGAVLGAALLYIVTPEETRGSLGVPSLGIRVTEMQGLMVECLISCVLVLVVCAVTDPKNKVVGNAAPVAIGLAVITSHIFAIPFTSCSMNPARALGPAVMSGDWDDHWIYWIGPLLGGIIGGLLYRLLFAASEEDQPVAE